MQVTSTDIEDVKLLQPKVFRDSRGWFSEVFNLNDMQLAELPTQWVQDNQSFSAPRHTLRGLHFQSQPHAQAKLVRVLRGRILDVAVDIRHDSPTYGKYVAFELTEQGAQIFIPAGFAHGFLTLEDNVEVLYKVSDFYAPDCDLGIAWNDPTLAIDWGVAEAQVALSEKDRKQPAFVDLPRYFTYQNMQSPQQKV